MAAAIECLLLDDSFQTEIIRTVKLVGRQDTFSQIISQLKVDEDGNIINVNEILVEENVSHQLSYLIGSINFLFNLATDETIIGGFSSQRRHELINSGGKIAGLLIDLLSELFQIDSPEKVNSIIRKFSERKTALKIEMGL